MQQIHRKKQKMVLFFLKLPCVLEKRYSSGYPFQIMGARCIAGDGGLDRHGGEEARGACLHALQGNARVHPALGTHFDMNPM